nr:hypothetical protein Iba_chr01cCG17300 [Ipomoea batatas]
MSSSSKSVDHLLFPKSFTESIWCSASSSQLKSPLAPEVISVAGSTAFSVFPCSEVDGSAAESPSSMSMSTWKIAPCSRSSP